jgi:hypothetical protein
MSAAKDFHNRRNRNDAPLSGERDRFRAIFQAEITEQHAAGKISEADYSKVFAASDKDRVIDRVIREAEKPTPDSAFSYSLNWDDIVQWVKDHWWDILKFVLTIALLFLDEGEV